MAPFRAPFALQVPEDVGYGAVGDALRPGDDLAVGHFGPEVALNRALGEQRATSVNTRWLIDGIYFIRKVGLIIALFNTCFMGQHFMGFRFLSLCDRFV